MDTSEDPKTPIKHNVSKWIEDNSKDFLPPVCNKMMHQQGQMKVMFIGGPNQRKDFHIDCGEELFYQIKGDMCLKVVEQHKHRDVIIKEGEMFLLPARVQHSPNRFADTIGLVLERRRHTEELDGLRYFVEENGKPTLQPLYEAWFYCTDLGTQLAPIIKEFFASEQYKTGKPLPGTVKESSPVELDHEIKLQDPFNFRKWLDEHRQQLRDVGKVPVFDCNQFQFQVYVYGNGCNEDCSLHAETYIWQFEGESKVVIEGKEHHLTKEDSLLVPTNQRFLITQDESSLCLVVWQDHTKAPTWPKES